MPRPRSLPHSSIGQRTDADSAMAHILEPFVEQCRSAAGGRAPLSDLIALMRAVLDARSKLIKALPPDRALESVVYSGADLTVIRVDCAPHSAHPPHDHGMPVVIGVLEGREQNTLYRKTAAGLVASGERSPAEGQLLVLGAANIHAVSNATEVRSVGLHVYLGDLMNQPRSIWDLRSAQVHPYTDETYHQLSSVGSGNDTPSSLR